MAKGKPTKPDTALVFYTNTAGSLLDTGLRALAEAETVEQKKQIRDEAEAWRQYIANRNTVQESSLQAQNAAAEIKLRAERDLGRALEAMEKHEGGRPTENRLHDATSSPPTLADLGIEKTQSSRWQTEAKVPDEDFEDWVEHEKDGGKELTSIGLYKKGSREAKAEENAVAKQDMEDRVTSGELPSGISILAGDFREKLLDTADESVDLIFTDPPYDRKSIPLYGDVAREAARVLRPGASIVVYAGAYILPQIFDLMCPHLTYQWTFAMLHSGGSARMYTKGIRVRWKPLLWFTKGKFDAQGIDMEDVIQSTPPEKVLHDWEQGVDEATYLIERLCPEGGMVLDPFCGSGTTLVAANKLDRRALGIEIDAEMAHTAELRLLSGDSDVGSR